MATKEKEKENTKVHVRFLPAMLSSDAFWKLIEEKVADKVIYWYYVPGKVGQKKYINSRAYIYFKTHEALCEFNQFFNGHAFVNSKGVEERALVEYAPYQKLPKLKKRTDLRMGTITEDADYLNFLEKLKEPPAPLPSAEVQLDRRLAEEKEKIAAAGGVMPAIVTPLMEDIRAKRAARNAPRTILQAPKRRGDRADKKRANKEDKEKRDSKAAKDGTQPRERNSRRRRDRDDRKKKKKDTKDDTEQGTEEGATQASSGHQPSHSRSSAQPQQAGAAAPEKAKTPRALWMIRNHITPLEPGSITIQTRGVATSSPGIKASPSSNGATGPVASSIPIPPPQSLPQQPQLLPPQPNAQPGAAQPQQSRKSRESGSSDRADFNRARGGRRESKKIYTPKQQQAQQQVPQQPLQGQQQAVQPPAVAVPTISKKV